MPAERAALRKQCRVRGKENRLAKTPTTEHGQHTEARCRRRSSISTDICGDGPTTLLLAIRLLHSVPWTGICGSVCGKSYAAGVNGLILCQRDCPWMSFSITRDWSRCELFLLRGNQRMPSATVSGEPDAGNPHVRFDEGAARRLGPASRAALYAAGAFGFHRRFRFAEKIFATRINSLGGSKRFGMTKKQFLLVRRRKALEVSRNPYRTFQASSTAVPLVCRWTPFASNMYVAAARPSAVSVACLVCSTGNKKGRRIQATPIHRPAPGVVWRSRYSPADASSSREPMQSRSHVHGLRNDQPNRALRSSEVLNRT